MVSIRRETWIKSCEVLGLIAIVALLAVGCGGDDQSTEASDHAPTPATKAVTTVTTGPLDKAQYIAHVNNYCRNSWTLIRQRVAAYEEELGSHISKEKAFTESIWRNILPGIQFQFDQMHEVLGGVPAGDERQVEEMIGTMQVAIETGEKRRPASPGQLTSLFATYNKRAEQYGVSDCVVNEANFGS